jgi:hypothetical protein
MLSGMDTIDHRTRTLGFDVVAADLERSGISLEQFFRIDLLPPDEQAGFSVIFDEFRRINGLPTPPMEARPTWFRGLIEGGKTLRPQV